MVWKSPGRRLLGGIEPSARLNFVLVDSAGKPPLTATTMSGIGKSMDCLDDILATLSFFFFFSNCTSNWLRLAPSCMTICQTIRAEGFWSTSFSFAHQCPSGKVIPDRCGNTWNVKRASFGRGVSERTREWLKF